MTKPGANPGFAYFRVDHLVWLKQATSYWEAAAGLLLFCGCCPAYTVPATPFGLNAEPRAFAALPGVLGAVALPHDWLGCPNALGVAAGATVDVV